jgi:hypothetical protein
MAFFTAVDRAVKEPDAPHATVLGSFVELGRFLLQEASQE